MCNKFADFTRSDVKMIEKVLNIVGVTFYIMNKFSDEKTKSDLTIFFPPKAHSVSTCPLGKSGDIELCMKK